METGDHVDDPNFPCALLARTALQALQVDPELSPLVRRRLAVVAGAGAGTDQDQDQVSREEEDHRILHVRYSATTNRMLRVAVNSFMDGLGLVVEVMEQLDVHVLEEGQQRERQGQRDEVERR